MNCGHKTELNYYRLRSLSYLRLFFNKKHKMFKYLIILALTTYIAQAQAQSATIGFYNVENLFDTIPSLIYEDEFTPKGRKAWTSDRYQNKMNNIAKVIDQMSCDVIGLCEVENEGVIRDLVQRLKTDYTYIHITSSDRRGLDLTLLYKADIFVPSHQYLITSPYREPMAIDGKLFGEDVTIVICHMPSRLNSRVVFDRSFSALTRWHDKVYDPKRSLILMGDFNWSTTEKSIKKLSLSRDDYYAMLTQLDNPVGRKFRDAGSYLYDGMWYLYDNILIDRRLSNGATSTVLQCGIYLKPFLLFESYKDRHNINSTYYKGRHNGGYSDHLPIFITLKI